MLKHAISQWRTSLSKVNVNSGTLLHVFQQWQTLGWVTLFFAGVRNWSEIYRYVMILARFEVGINMPICYLSMALEVSLNVSVIFEYLDIKLWDHPWCAISSANRCCHQHVSMLQAPLKSRAMCVKTETLLHGLNQQLFWQFETLCFGFCRKKNKQLYRTDSLLLQIPRAQWR